MDSTQYTLKKDLGTFEYAKLLDNANQISIFGQSVNKLSREELLVALAFTMQSNQEPREEHITANNLRHLPTNTQTVGLW